MLHDYVTMDEQISHLLSNNLVKCSTCYMYSVWETNYIWYLGIAINALPGYQI